MLRLSLLLAGGPLLLAGCSHGPDHTTASAEVTPAYDEQLDTSGCASASSAMRSVLEGQNEIFTLRPQLPFAEFDRKTPDKASYCDTALPIDTLKRYAEFDRINEVRAESACRRVPSISVRVISSTSTEARTLRRIVIYEESRHSVGGDVPSASLGCLCPL